MPVNSYKQRLRHMFELTNRNQPTRRTNDLSVEVPDIRSTLGCKADSYMGPAFWNNIDVKLEVKDPKNCFKTAYTRFLWNGITHPQ